MNVGIFCGTAGGTSMKIANSLAKSFGVNQDDVINMEDDFDDIEQLLEYDVLFLGSSTWGQGDVHHSWVDVLLDIESENIDFSGKIVAFYGAGDSVKHKEHFCSALGKLYDVFVGAGAIPVGMIPKDNYNYQFSLAQKGEMFCGLGIDEHNEAEKTNQRIEEWIKLLKNEIKEG